MRSKSARRIFTLLLTFFVCHHTVVAADMAAAQQALESGKYRSAIIYLKNVLQEYPEDVDARLLLGQVYIKTLSGEDAEKEIKQAMTLGSVQEDTLVLLARAYLIQGKAQEVIDEIAFSKEMTNKSKTEITTIRGDAFLELGDTLSARLEYEAALSLQQNSPDALAGLARVAILTGDHKAAENYVNRAVAAAPRNIMALTAKAELEFKQGNFEQAIKFYNRALTIRVDYFPALMGKADSFIALNQFEKADQSVVRILKNWSEEPKAHYLKAQIELTRKNYQGALASIDVIEGYTDTHWPSKHLKAIIYYLTGRPEQAAEVLRTLTANFPGHIGAVKLLATVYMDVGDPNKAVRLLEPLINKTQDAEVFTLLGRASAQLKNYDAATKYYEKAVILSPRDVTVRRLLAVNVMNAGGTDEAISNLKAAIQLDPDAIQQKYLLITALLRKEEFDAALFEADSLIAKDDENPYAFNLKGNAYLGKGDGESARQAFEQAVAVAPKYITAYLNLGRMAEREGDLVVAKKQYRNALDIKPDNTAALLSLVNMEIRAGNLNGAFSLLDGAEAANPNSIEPTLAKIDIYLSQKRFDVAVKEAEKKLQEHDESAELLEAYGRSLALSGDFDRARSVYRDVTRQYPSSAHAWTMLAVAERKQHEFASAERHLQKALQLDGSSFDALVNMAGLQLQDKNPEKAVEYAKIIRKHYPKLSISYEIEGKAALQLKDISRAEKAFSQGFNLQMTSALAVKTFQVRKYLGRTSGLYQTLNAWLKVNPDDVQVRLLLASELAKSGDFDGAQLHLERVLQNTPNHPVALNDLALILHRKKDTRALDYARLAFEQLPENPNTMDTLGWILVEHGKKEEGLSLLKEARKLSPGNGDINYHLAVAYHQSKQSKVALQILEEQLRDNNNFPTAKAAQRLLEKIKNNASI